MGIKSLIPNDIQYHFDKNISQLFSDYFSNIAGDMINQIPTSDVDPLHFVTRNSASCIQ